MQNFWFTSQSIHVSMCDWLLIIDSIWNSYTITIGMGKRSFDPTQSRKREKNTTDSILFLHVMINKEEHNLSKLIDLGIYFRSSTEETKRGKCEWSLSSHFVIPILFFFGVFSAKFHRTCTKTRSGRAAVRCEEEGYFVSIFLTLLWFMHDEIAFPFSFHWQWVGQIVCKLFQTHAHTLVAFWLQHKFGASFTCRIVFTYLKNVRMIFTGLYNNNQRKKTRTVLNYLKFSVCLTSNTMLFLQSLSSSSFLLLLFWKMTPHLNIFRVWLAQCSVMNWMRTTYVEDCFISFRFVPFRIESSCSMFV